MNGNSAQESHMDFYAQFDSLKALEKKFLKYNRRFFSAVQTHASQTSPIWQSGWFGQQYSVRPRKTGGKISKIPFSMLKDYQTEHKNPHEILGHLFYPFWFCRNTVLGIKVSICHQKYQEFEFKFRFLSTGTSVIKKYKILRRYLFQVPSSSCTGWKLAPKISIFSVFCTL